MDIFKTSVEDVLQSAEVLSEHDARLWSLALVSTDSNGDFGLTWLSGMDYNEVPRNAHEWKLHSEMQSRYLMARSQAGESVVLPNGLRCIRMFAEWVDSCPLWESFTDNYPLQQGSLPISDELWNELVKWNREYRNRDEDEPIPDERGWLARGTELHNRLQNELVGVAEVVPEF